MKRTILLCFVLLLCSCASHETRQAEKLQAIELRQSEVVEALKRLPKNWKISTFREPILKCDIKVAEITAAESSSNRPKVLLIHGLGEKGMEDWISVAPALSPYYDLLCLDLPGFGRSDKPEIKYSPTNYAHVLHEVKKRYAPSDKLLVIGYSMGGAVALRYADLYPRELESLVLISVAGILERTSYLKFSIQQFLENVDDSTRFQSVLRVLKNPIGKLIESINGLPDPTQLLRYDRVWQKVFDGRERFNAGMSLIGEDFSKAIYRNHKRVKIIWGDEDNIAPLRTGKLLAKQIPHAELHVIKGSGHAPMKTHSKELNDLILLSLSEGKDAIHTPKKISTKTDVLENLGSLHLKGEKNVMIENKNFRRVILERCEGVTFKNVSLESLSLFKSSVVLEDVEVHSEGLAMSVDKSVVQGTNVRFNGVHGIEANGSRLDLVGTHIASLEEAVKIKEKSQLLFSISQMKSSSYSGYLHGSYRLSKIVLDEHLVEND